MIVIASMHGDDHARHVAKILDERARDYVWLNPSSLPSTATLTMQRANDGDSDSVVLDDQVIDMGNVSSIWYRRPEPPDVEAISDIVHRAVAETQWSMALSSLWERPGAHLVPGHPLDLGRADHKAYQLTLARACGFCIPDTLITNDPGAVSSFFNKHGGALVSKLLYPIAFSRWTRQLSARTEPVTHRDMMHVAAIRWAPAIFQQRIQKRIELRITVVGERVLTAAVFSQEQRRTRHDYRVYGAQTRYEPFELDEATSRRCRQLVARLGLSFGAIDAIVTPKDEFVFLEINSNGQWLWIEASTGLAIGAAIADLLGAS